jgi:chromosome segregation ATPase
VTKPRTTDDRLATLEDAASAAAAKLKDIEADIAKHDSDIIDHQRQIARLDRLVESNAKQLDDLAVKVEKVAAQVDSIHTRLDRHEEYHEEDRKTFIKIGMALSAADEARKGDKAELKDFILEKVVKRGPALPPSLEAEELRAKLAGMAAQLAAAERERDDLRALVSDRP